MAFDQRLPAVFYADVQDGVRAALAAERVDALLTDSPEDVAYLTGFFHHPCERPVAVWIGVDGTTALLLPELEVEHARVQNTAAELVVYPEYPGVVPPFDALAGRVPRGRRVGHPGGMAVDRLAAVRAAFPGAEFVRTGVAERARLRKRPEEIALHREAGRITDAMLTAGRDLIEQAVGAGGELPSEAELAAHVTSFGSRTMYAEHDDVVVVSPLAGGLVYAAENSARPHGLPSARRLRPGDTFVLSLGCAVGGRFVEGERTFVLGEPSAEQRRYYEAVREAQAVGAASIRPGARCADVNRTCLDVIRDAGLEGFLRHRQGHGIGLGMHEPPWLEDGDATVLEPGMVVSNEPGIYVTGHAGYRISDSMLVTDDAATPFTFYPRSLDDVVVPV
ncbi:M24 family metallopeptidase [Actinoallomurus iriomotensis]|uniref:Xaa-Pro aminopeptidase n=1 Tax=Actinoallomurus iriomotensis TaxID=478107 RepID=A0A9W6VUX0_9ACTN|nr:Xaa-Pro peptidase family protein [Actinoallomurus iriomotensis]GLY80604.1 Xaa-Pro aminopeptidase [Actinoallomurus iriomotensis]